MTATSIPVTPLGQAGFRLGLGSTTVYIDPYLSNYVEEVEGPRAKRLVPIAIEPAQVNDADWVLITHEHMDHCDPKTVGPLAAGSPQCRFVGPAPVRTTLAGMGIAAKRMLRPPSEWTTIGHKLRLRAVPAAHPDLDRDESGFWRYVGYLIDYHGKKIYHSGDTSVCPELIAALQHEGGIDVAFVSVNERNFYRDRLGIVGNMSLREAFQLAEDAGVRRFVPMHWDMFAPNSVFLDEIKLLYAKMSPSFSLTINPSQL